MSILPYLFSFQWHIPNHPVIRHCYNEISKPCLFSLEMTWQSLRECYIFNWDEEMVFYSQTMELENCIFCSLHQCHVQMDVSTCECYCCSWMSLCSKEVIVKHGLNIRNPYWYCHWWVWNFMIIQQNVVCFTRSASNKIEVTCENMHTNLN
jgi:hypothetical protein